MRYLTALPKRLFKCETAQLWVTWPSAGNLLERDCSDVGQVIRGERRATEGCDAPTPVQLSIKLLGSVVLWFWVCILGDACASGSPEPP